MRRRVRSCLRHARKATWVPGFLIASVQSLLTSNDKADLRSYIRKQGNRTPLAGWLPEASLVCRGAARGALCSLSGQALTANCAKPRDRRGKSQPALLPQNRVRF